MLKVATHQSSNEEWGWNWKLRPRRCTEPRIRRGRSPWGCRLIRRREWGWLHSRERSRWPNQWRPMWPRLVEGECGERSRLDRASTFSGCAPGFEAPSAPCTIRTEGNGHSFRSRSGAGWLSTKCLRSFYLIIPYTAQAHHVPELNRANRD